MGIYRKSQLMVHSTTFFTVTGTQLLDLFPGAKAAYSFRKLRTNYGGSAVRIRRATDNSEQDIGFVANNFDSASAATFISGSTGYIVKWYDQSGNSFDLSQSTAANQPLYSKTGLANLPSVQFEPNNVRRLIFSNASGSSGWLGAQPLASVYAVVDLVKNRHGDKRIIGWVSDVNGGNEGGADVNAVVSSFSGVPPTNGGTYGYRNTVLDSGTIKGFGNDFVVGEIWDGSQITGYADDVADTPAAVSANFSATVFQIRMGNDVGAAGANNWQGNIFEVVVWPSVVNHTSVNTSIKTYYSLPNNTTLVLDQFPGPKAAYSFRKLRSAYAGSAVRIRRSSDSTEQDIGFSGNDFDSASAAAFIGGGTGFIKTWYDQSGNGYDVTQATAGQQPDYVASGIGSKPCLSFVTSRSTVMTTALDAVAFNSSKLYCTAVGYYTASSDAFGRLVSILGHGDANDFTTTNSIAVILKTGGDVIEAFANGAALSGTSGDLSIAANTPYRMMFSLNGVDNEFYVSGEDYSQSAYTGTVGNANGTVTLYLGADNSGTNWDGQVSEVILYDTDQRGNTYGIDCNLTRYYGI